MSTEFTEEEEMQEVISLSPLVPISNTQRDHLFLDYVTSGGLFIK